MTHKISICIPSFNRQRHLLSTLKAISAQSHDIDFIEEIVLVDDGYTIKERDEIILEMQSHPKFRYHRADSSGSFGNVYLECINIAKTDYVLITYDDDELFVRNLIKIRDTLCNHDWSIIVPVWLSAKNKLLRGSKRQSHIVKQHKILRYMAHAPGIIYNKNTCSTELSMLTERLSTGCLLSGMYPQVFLAALLLSSKKNIMSTPIKIGKDGAELPTEIKTKNGKSYSSLQARLCQYSDLIEINDSDIMNDNIIKNLRVEFFARILLEQSRGITLSAFYFFIQRRLRTHYRISKHKIKNLLTRIFD